VRRNRIAVATVLGLTALCVAGSYAVVYGVFGRYARQRDSELALARAEGIPLEPQDLARSVPAAQNAAPLYRRAIAIVHDRRLGKAMDAASVAVLPNATQANWEAGVRALPSLDPALAEVERASSLPACDFQRNWALGPNLALPEYASMKRLVSGIALRAEVDAERGDGRAALRELRRAYYVARHAAQDPCLISMLVGIACENIAHRSFRRVVSRCATDPKFLAEAAQLQAELPPVPSLRHAMGGEVVMGRVAIPMIESLSQLAMTSHAGDEKPFFAERAFLQSAPVQGAFEAKFVRAWREAYRLLPRDSRDWEAGARAMDRITQAIDTDTSLANRANLMLLGYYERSAEAVGRLVAERRLNVTGLRLLAERARTGAFPARLPQPRDGAWRDPFAPGPLGYRRLDGGFCLYSVDSDRHDDGGLAAYERVKSGPYDLVFRYPARPRRAKSRSWTSPRSLGPALDGMD
jgi:hypothetical protein